KNADLHTRLRIRESRRKRRSGSATCLEPLLFRNFAQPTIAAPEAETADRQMNADLNGLPALRGTCGTVALGSATPTAEGGCATRNQVVSWLGTEVETTDWNWIHNLRLVA